MRRKVLAAAMMALLGFAGAALFAAAERFIYVHHPGSFYFLDVASDSPHNEDIGYAAEYGVVSGYWDGTYHPTEAVTREQMASFVMRSSAVDPVAAVLIVDNDYFAGYYYGITALEEGRITGEEYETFQSFLDWWYGMADFQASRAAAPQEVTKAIALMKEVRARNRAAKTR
jgi:hypothetical protein